jgi:ribosome-associated protein
VRTGAFRDKLVADAAAVGECVTKITKRGTSSARVETTGRADVGTKSRIAARAADDKKGDDILVLDVADIIGIVECFVITSASNTRLVRSIVEDIERQIYEQTGEKPRAIEGLRDASWVLIDYGDLVVHVFLAETREFYGLERLWADADRVEWADSATAS